MTKVRIYGAELTLNEDNQWVGAAGAAGMLAKHLNAINRLLPVSWGEYVPDPHQALLDRAKDRFGDGLVVLEERQDLPWPEGDEEKRIVY